VQRALGTGDGDVGEAALLGLLAVADGPPVWEAALFGAGDPHVVELEALGAVDRGERDRVAGDRARLRGERELGEEVGQPGAAAAALVGARVRDEGPEVLELPRARQRVGARAVPAAIRCSRAGWPEATRTAMTCTPTAPGRDASATEAS
jgi:hypothetical protein